MLHNWHLSILRGRHITAGALGIRMMEFRVRVREHTSKSVICGSGTDHAVHLCAQGVRENAKAPPQYTL